MLQLIVHGLADFFFGQASYQAINKSKAYPPAIVHVLLYTACFLVLTLSWKALLVIGVTHFLIDRYSIPKYLIFAREWILNPKSWRATWPNCNHTGFFDHVGDAWGDENQDKMRPPWLTWWLVIIFDNILHLTCNYFALKYLA